MDSIAAGELPQADGISWKYKNSIEFPKTDHELSGHGIYLTYFSDALWTINMQSEHSPPQMAVATCHVTLFGCRMGETWVTSPKELLTGVCVMVYSFRFRKCLYAHVCCAWLWHTATWHLSTFLHRIYVLPCFWLFLTEGYDGQNVLKMSAVNFIDFYIVQVVEISHCYLNSWDSWQVL